MPFTDLFYFDKMNNCWTTWLALGIFWVLVFEIAALSAIFFLKGDVADRDKAVKTLMYGGLSQFIYGVCTLGILYALCYLSLKTTDSWPSILGWVFFLSNFITQIVAALMMGLAIFSEV